MLLDLIWQRDGLFLTFSLCTWRKTFPVQFCKTNACAFDLQLLLPSAVSEMISYELWQWLPAQSCFEICWSDWWRNSCCAKNTGIQCKTPDTIHWLDACHLGRKYSRKTSLANDKGQARPMSGLVMQISSVQLHGKNLHQLAHSIFIHFPHAYYTGLTRIWRFFKAFPVHSQN